MSSLDISRLSSRFHRPSAGVGHASPADWRSRIATASRFPIAPLVGAVLIGVTSRGVVDLYEVALPAFLAFAYGAALTGRPMPGAVLLPIMNVVRSAMGPVLGGLLILASIVVSGRPKLSVIELAAIVLATSLVALIPTLWAPVAFRRRPRRVALIGSRQAAAGLQRELEAAGVEHQVLVGRIGTTLEPSSAGAEVPLLGALADLGQIVEAHDVQLLVMGTEVQRLAVFDVLTQGWLSLPVRVCDLVFFYEEVFGHIPVAAINTSWFNYIMHPHYRVASPAWKKLLDVVLALLVGLVFLPVLLLAAVLIHLDGGPVFFKQVRVGEGGRPFTLYKLRTMRPEAGRLAQWAAKDDPRVTPVGRLLRKFHLDELPQLVNVVRGEMSMVGPRPEQPGFMQHLEALLPHYQRRHLIKPGMTGWAQVRCGYAGSDIGSAWKLCHDLYYVKHRSIMLDMMILGETLRTLFASPHQAIRSQSVSFILAPQDVPAPGIPSAGQEMALPQPQSQAS